jgi:hypothetical protein
MALHLDTEGGDLRRARELCESSLAAFRRASFIKGEANVLLIQSYIEESEAQYQRAMELALDCARLSEQIGWTSWQAGALEAAGENALRLKRLKDAARHKRQALALERQIGSNRLWMALSLAGLARIAAASGDAESAGLFVGAVEAESERNRLGMWEVRGRERTTRELAVVAGPELERGIARGRALTLDEATALALGCEEAFAN